MTNTRKSSKRKMTKRKIIGGNINNQVGLDKILSIGYEVESTNLIKLTKNLETGDSLYNTDTKGLDMEEFENMIKRREQTFLDYDKLNISRGSSINKSRGLSN